MDETEKTKGSLARDGIQLTPKNRAFLEALASFILEFHKGLVEALNVLLCGCYKMTIFSERI